MTRVWIASLRNLDGYEPDDIKAVFGNPRAAIRYCQNRYAERGEPTSSGFTWKDDYRITTWEVGS